jgi:hypothetical protein
VDKKERTVLPWAEGRAEFLAEKERGGSREGYNFRSLIQCWGGQNSHMASTATVLFLYYPTISLWYLARAEEFFEHVILGLSQLILSSSKGRESRWA